MGAHKLNKNAYQPPLIGQVRKIVVGTPAGDMMKTLTAQCRERILMYSMSRGLEVAAGMNLGTYVEMNQNFMVRDALQANADALFLMDSDMTAPPEALEVLISRAKSIVGAAYRRRMRPRRMNVKKLDDTFATGKETGMEEVQFVASGMLLIRTSVLRSMKYPWFWNFYGEKFEDFRGNDVNFCLVARAAGHKIWCDHDLSEAIGHIGDEIITKGHPE